MEPSVRVALIRKRGIFPTKKYLRALSEGTEALFEQSENWILQAYSAGTLATLPESCTDGAAAARALSRMAGGPVLFCHIDCGDFWGYELFDCGEETDRFCPVPDYFGAVDDAARRRCAGNPVLLARAFDVPEGRVAGYLRFWPEDGLEERAYPEDACGCEPGQMWDFLAALGFPRAAEGNSAAEPTAPAQAAPPAAPVSKELEAAPGEGREQYHFQVNLGGMLDILSNHLYKSPDVFLRELLLNGVDAITLRQKAEPNWTGGRITITVEPGRRLIFRDNGAGLTEAGIHRFLAVIGQSSKTGLVNGKLPEDYIGRFGIGLLSCFMVSDTIVVHTRPAAGGPAHVWIGRPDGTYSLEPLGECLVGTAVILTAKPGAEHYFRPDKVDELVRYYGLALPVPIFRSGSPEPLNRIPADFTGISRSQLLGFGAWLFDEEFLDAIPIQTPHISGVAYVLPYRTDRSLKSGHRIYLKQMLLTERGDTLLPQWAFFLRCFLNTRGLRPTASREDFYEDEALSQAREEFAHAVRDSLARTAREDPERLRQIVSVHAQAIKAMAVWDDELFRIFIDYLPFQTSEGTLTGAALKQAGTAVWADTVPRFQQLRPIFMAQGRLLVCAGYTSDGELLQKLSRIYGLDLSPLNEDGMELIMEDAAPAEARQGAALLTAADRCLADFDCAGELRRFLPVDLPALYSVSGEVEFFRHLQSARETSSGVFSQALSSMLEGMEEKPLATLYLNLNTPLVQRLTALPDGPLLESAVRLLYFQALLAGGHPLRGSEMKSMNAALSELLEYAADSETEQ